MKLTADVLFLANDPDYLKKYPEVKREITRFVKDMPPEECLCCVFFKWIRDEEKRISGRMCCAKQEIQEEDFAEGQRAKGCPADE